MFIEQFSGFRTNAKLQALSIQILLLFLSDSRRHRRNSSSVWKSEIADRIYRATPISLYSIYGSIRFSSEKTTVAALSIPINKVDCFGGLLRDGVTSLI